MKHRPTTPETYPSHTNATSPLASWLGKKLARWHYARHVEPTWLEENHLQLPIVGLPAACDGITIAHLSDIHDGPQLPKQYLQEVIERTNAHQPDIIALTGDYIHAGYHAVESVGKTLGQLRARLGIYAVLGNHDFSVRNALGRRRHPGLHQAIANSLAAQGIRVLRNEGLLIQDGLAIAGIDDLWSRECLPERALEHLPNDIPRILLAHNPMTVEQLAGHRSDLMLSGHTHGGQVMLPRFGRIFLGRDGRRMAAGLHQHPASPVYVSKGVGFGWRLRYGVRPEIALIKLIKAEQPTL